MKVLKVFFPGGTVVKSYYQSLLSLQTSDMLQAGFQYAWNLSSDSFELRCAVVTYSNM